MRAATRAVALVAVVSVSVMGLAGAASAKAAKGSPAWCKAHRHSTLSACRGSSPGGGSGGPSPTMTVTVAPDPLVETGQSEIRAVVEVETSPSLSGAAVHIDSSQLAAVCGGAVLFGSLQPGAVYGPDSVQVVLDADGNATVSLYGIDCAPGPSVVEADLVAAPYYTALTTLNVLPPNVTPAGVTGDPANEVETGNTAASGDSDVYAVFYVETDPVYAEQTVEIGSTQLFSRCLGAIAPVWISNQGSFTTSTATATLDDDGNAVFSFTGSSCAAGTSTVIADVLAGVHSTYVTTYTILAPAPTI
ncbi:MAG TPA: hypothetical protein VNC61_00665 [Acidimicrobiales bacterium]|nr:hypothetical protein [Acidimicrobiales bacterium]